MNFHVYKNGTLVYSRGYCGIARKGSSNIFLGSGAETIEIILAKKGIEITKSRRDEPLNSSCTQSCED